MAQKDGRMAGGVGVDQMGGEETLEVLRVGLLVPPGFGGGLLVCAIDGHDLAPRGDVALSQGRQPYPLGQVVGPDDVAVERGTVDGGQFLPTAVDRPS